MKKLFLVVTCLVAFVSLCRAQQRTFGLGSLYLSSLYSGGLFHVEDVLSQDVTCLLDDTACTSAWSLGALKTIIIRYLQNGCTGCSEIVRIGAIRAIDFLREHKPHVFKFLQDKYGDRGRQDNRLNKKENS